jgi:hypothetical protein
MKAVRVLAILLALATAGARASPECAGDPPLAIAFEATVVPRLQPPPEAVAAYALALDDALEAAGAPAAREPAFTLVVDRSPAVQALLVFWGTRRNWLLVGSTPVSTGRPGSFDHFRTPLGVFEHGLASPDFRAEGTRNANGIRGYGRKGSRVFDFGWIDAPKGWGDGAVIAMRLQMHATDPDRLEQRLGSPQSKGCIRIPATLNAFLDHFGILDRDYDDAVLAGRSLWVLDAGRTPTPWSGRYLVIVDSGMAGRPDWSPAPAH